MIFAIKKSRGICNINNDCYEIDTRQNMNIHMYQVNLAKYWKGVYHMAVRIYNGLPNKLKIISNKFKASLKEYLHLNSYYILDELFNLRDDNKITI
jgi:hypothetical protein